MRRNAIGSTAASLLLAACREPPRTLSTVRSETGAAQQDASASAQASTSTTPPSPVTSPPPALACVARWYAGKPRLDAAGWSFVLDDGRVVPWNDGRAKSFEEKLASPDLHDAFSIAYRAGPITPVATADDDPGRIRIDPLFTATYGHDAAEVRAQLTPWTLLGQTLVVHRRARPAFDRVGVRLAALVRADPTLDPYLHGLGGTFIWRTIAGTDRRSAHSYGISLDLNPARSDYWRSSTGPIVWRNRIPRAIVDAFEAEGFVWGGRWFHYDTMHFEYRPELIDPACR